MNKPIPKPKSQVLADHFAATTNSVYLLTEGIKEAPVTEFGMFLDKQTTRELADALVDVSLLLKLLIQEHKDNDSQ